MAAFARPRLTLATAIHPPEADPEYLEQLAGWADDKAAELETLEAPGIVRWDGSPVPVPDVVLGPEETAELLRRADARAILEQTGARPLSMVSRDAPPPLLLDRLDALEATVLFGDGGAGKGTIACSWIVGLVVAGHRVLVVDYEHHPTEWARRIAALGGSELLSDVVYVSPVEAAWLGPRGAIWDASGELHELARQTQATYVVVDSAVPACGATNPMDPEAPGQYFGALARIGLPSLTLAHVNRAGDLRSPFGSAFWANLARVTWSAVKVGTDGHQVMLQHRKGNNVARQGKFLVTVEWWEGLPREVREQPYSQRLAEQLTAVLEEGPLTVAEIVARLNEDRDEDDPPIKADSIRHTLRRGIKADPQLYTVEGSGNGARWSNAV